MHIFSVTFLGTSAAIPSPHRHLPAQLLRYETERFLIDAGDGTLMQLIKNNLSLTKISVIFVSHLHGDHTLGIPAVLSSMSLLGREKPLLIIGPQGIQKFVRNVFANIKSKLSFELQFKELTSRNKEKIWENEALEVYSFPLKHSTVTWGFLFVEKVKPRKLLAEKLQGYKLLPRKYGLLKQGIDVETEDGILLKAEEFLGERKPSYSYAYCSDTAFFEELPSLIQGTDVIFHESTFTEKDRDKAEATKHSTAKDAATVAKKAAAKVLYIGHFSNRYFYEKPLLYEARKIFKNTFAVQENQTVSIPEILEKYETEQSR